MLFYKEIDAKMLNIYFLQIWIDPDKKNDPDQIYLKIEILQKYCNPFLVFDMHYKISKWQNKFTAKQQFSQNCDAFQT